MTADWAGLLVRPADTTPRAWLRRIAEHLLGRAALVAAGRPHRVVELEVYLHDAAHPDPFAHRDPRQRAWGTWYLHRSGEGLRAGSFKGIDLTFGDPDAYGGVLLRSLERPDGGLVSGPSLVVDYLMAQVGAPTVSALDALIGAAGAARAPDAAALSPDLPVRMADSRDPGDVASPVYRTARVGLTLKRAAAHPDMEAYIGLPYRFLTGPRRIRKGRVELALALHARGASARDICRITGSPRAAVDRHVAAFEAGRGEDLAAFRGAALDPEPLARLLGAWHARYGAAD